MTNPTTLDEEEQAAMDAILAAEDAVLGLGGGLKANDVEFVIAIHGLQSFVVQHMLHRLDPEKWSSWFAEAELVRGDARELEASIDYHRSTPSTAFTRLEDDE